MNSKDGHGTEADSERVNNRGSSTTEESSNHTHVSTAADAHDILANLKISFQKEAATAAADQRSLGAENPLLALLTQNSAERARIAEVGHQLGPENTRVPQVIGDFVGLTGLPGTTSSASRSHGSIGGGTPGTYGGRKSSSASSSNNGSGEVTGAASLHEGLENIQLGGEDDELNELDVDEDDGSIIENAIINLDKGLNVQADGGLLERASDTISSEARSAASAVDPRQLIGAIQERTSEWDILSDFQPSMGMLDDDDELDENDPAMEELGFALAPKSKREKKKMQKKGVTPVYPPEVQKLLGMANTAYVNKNYKEAVDLFQQVIVTHPSVFQAWNIMGVIQEELGNTEKALQLYLVAAHLTPKDAALWKKLAVISKDCGYDQQALYCFSRAYRADKDDMDALWDRSIMYQILDQPYKAIAGLQKLLKVRQHYMPALEELVKIYSSLDQDNKRYREYMHQAMVDYEAAYLHYSSLPDHFANVNGDPFEVSDEVEQHDMANEPFGYSALNMLSELYIMFDEYEKPIKMIKTWSRRLQRRSHQTWWDDYKDDREFDTDPDDEELQASLGENRTRGLPVDLRVKLGICRLMMEEVKEAKAQFRYLWRCSVEDFPDLYEEIAELYVNKRMWKEGYNVIRAMLQYDEMDIPKIWIMAGECLRHMDRLKDAKDYLEQAHRADPTNVDVSMMLAEVYEEMGNLPQALTMVNYVRKANAEKQADAERKRKEARQVRQSKSGGASSSRDAQNSEGYGLAPQPYLEASHYDGKYRHIAPRPGSSSSTWQLGSDAARDAMERITEASRSRAAAERYSSADRDRDIQLVRSIREQERADKIAEKDVELHDVIDKFNKLDLIYQKISQKEKSRSWLNKHEAVKITREERIQYIQAARDLVNVFRSNRAFFNRERNKPYTGVESRAWRSRRNTADADTVLSEHATEMADRLARAMGIASATQMPRQEPTEQSNVKSPTTFREVSFDVWYLLMIRQGVYLTFEDRYAEALDLLMLMFRANVFYSVPRRRSGIMLVLLACAMWAKDHATVINAGRWLTIFGGMRPFAFKIYQGTFTSGPRDNHEHFVWAQNITQKFMKRHIIRMRSAVGKGLQRGMRKSYTPHRKQRIVTQRRKRSRNFLLSQSTQPSQSLPKKKPRLDLTVAGHDDNGISFPWKLSSNIVSASHTPSQQENRVQETQETQENQVQSEAQETETATSATAGIKSRSSLQGGSTDKNISTRNPRGRVSFSEASKGDGGMSSPSLPSHGRDGPTAAAIARRRKRQLTEDEGEEFEENDQTGEKSNKQNRNDGQNEQDDTDQNEQDDDDDDYDVNDELYKTEEEDDNDNDDNGETDWENDAIKFSRSRAKMYGKNKQADGIDDDDNYENDDNDDNDDYDDDSPESNGLSRGPKKGRRSSESREGSSSTQHDGASKANYAGIRVPRMFTKESYPQFHIHMTMFSGSLLAASRSHVGSAAQYAECMDHAPLNPLIQLYLANQMFCLAMQRTTPNRQMAMAQGLVFFQNYYRLRSLGYGTLAFAERERERQSKGLPPTPSPIGPVHSIVGVVGNKGTTNWEAQAVKASTEALATSTSISTASSVTISEVMNPSVAIPTTADGDDAATPVQTVTSVITNSNLSTMTTTTVPDLEDQPLKHCQQEAEYNFARGFHQLGQNHLAMIHYRRVLELPSWREAEREQEEQRKKQNEAKKQAKRQARSEARASILEQKMKRAQERRESKDAQKAVVAIQRGGSADQDDNNEMTEENDDEFEYDHMEEVNDDDDDDDDDDDFRASAETTQQGPVSRLKLQDEDEDPTDLKREAAFNLAKIYMQSGAMGEANLLIRKYCTF
ncbi:transcription factor TFIIIC subunit tfc4 [Lobosporangium transversale]|uniref:Suppressor of forked domain-containing protein n=1 Tax=Lobosporangium transversale TaxID=64571 RepID=A0A1Y2GTC4_9FUNG|nr:hypothetical protein BCR41DRAFT_351087 [Lobosporangium transversale]KAF9913447.1 transcription factor TFIIIC subunit tfc4 [Lobosporangium transversale]ORZ19980.1 hypothetical protein BCR41DRAFT_351087 [Lobosporangium transversale]|eukprot:XP_021882520.1 hypothetical protein BCR41DRAFT_351087 [Lobosporangium transversale]